MGQRPLGSVALHPYRSVFASHRFAIAALMLLNVSLLTPSVGSADQQILAISGDAQPGGSGAQLAGVGTPTLNNSGQVVLQARLTEGVGGVDSQNDAALWFIDGSARELLAWKGAGDLSNGASYASFAAASIADDGDVVFKAATDGGKQGFWRASRDGGRSTIALSATTGVPGSQLQNAQYQTFGFQLLHAPSDVVAFNSKMVREVGGVDNSNSRGVWRNNGVATELLVRELISDVPSLPAAKFLVPSAEGINIQGQTALLGSLVNGYGDVTTQNALAIWRLGGGGNSDVLIARKSIGEAAGVAGGLFGGFSDLHINAAGAISYVGELQLGGDVTAENMRGLWLFDGSDNRLGYCPTTVLLRFPPLEPLFARSILGEWMDTKPCASAPLRS